MYQKGEYVVCGSKGVCIVEDITTLDISGVDKTREYYILKPLYAAASTVYVPVDVAKDSLRRVITADEAKAFVQTIPDISLLDIANDKLLEPAYKQCLKANCCDEWVRIIKTIYQRRQTRMEAGRKETAIDVRYCKIAEDGLYGELAAALNISRDSIEKYIVDVMNQGVLV